MSKLAERMINEVLGEGVKQDIIRLLKRYRGKHEGSASSFAKKHPEAADDAMIYDDDRGDVFSFPSKSAAKGFASDLEDLGWDPLEPSEFGSRWISAWNPDCRS